MVEVVEVVGGVAVVGEIGGGGRRVTVMVLPAMDILFAGDRCVTYFNKIRRNFL